MKIMWCWRCKMEMPMLDEDEYAIIYKLLDEAFTVTKQSRIENNLPIENLTMADIFRPVREKYKELTGYEEANHNAIMHHRISIYGEPCSNCGKPLRTPKASFCVACGQVKD